MKFFSYMKKYFYNLFKGRKESKKEKEKVAAETRKYLQTIQDGRNLPIVLSSIILPKSETCYFDRPARMYDTKMTTKHVVGHSGISIKIHKRLSFNIGGSRSRDIRKKVKSKFPGQLCITNKRIIFTGEKKNFTVTYPKLIAINHFKHRFEFRTEKTNYYILVNVTEDINYVDAILKGLFTNYVSE